MITGMQIRSARAAVRWSARELAEKAGIGYRTISRIEDADDIPMSRADTLIKIQNALESAGIEFIGSSADAPGIRLRRKP